MESHKHHTAYRICMGMTHNVTAYRVNGILALGRSPTMDRQVSGLSLILQSYMLSKVLVTISPSKQIPYLIPYLLPSRLWVFSMTSQSSDYYL